MNLLTTLNNQFHFNLPTGFVPATEEERYMKLLGAKRKLHNTVLDYLNSTIQQITFPGVKFPTVDNPQNLHKKKIKWKSANNIFNLFDDEITVTFLNVDSNLNYLIMMDILINHYLNTDTTYDESILITVLDERRNALYYIHFKDVMWTGIDSNAFAYNEQSIQGKTFTCTFTFNFIDFNYVADNTDIITNDKYGNFN